MEQTKKVFISIKIKGSHVKDERSLLMKELNY